MRGSLPQVITFPSHELRQGRCAVTIQDQKAQIGRERPKYRSPSRSNAAHSTTAAGVAGNKSCAIGPVRVSPRETPIHLPSQIRGRHLRQYDQSISKEYLGTTATDRHR